MTCGWKAIADVLKEANEQGVLQEALAESIGRLPLREVRRTETVEPLCLDCFESYGWWNLCRCRSRNGNRS